MNGLLTNIAGQFAKPLVLAALLPVIVVFSLFMVSVQPLFPVVLPAPLQSVETSWQVGWGAVFALVLAMLLYVMNTMLTRFASGYGWKDGYPGKILTGLRRWHFRRLVRRRDGLLALSRKLSAATPREKAIDDRLWKALTPLAQQLNDEFPYNEDLILPTRLGNVIRNFEQYSQQRYGVSAVPLWPRLVGVLDPRYATVLDDVKTGFDFALNCLVLLSLTAALTAARAWAARGPFLPAVMCVALFLVLAGLAYAAATERARAWGTHVKAAIDLYRGPLMKALGYQRSLVDIADERDNFWSVLASEWRFPDMADALEAVPFQPPVAAAAPPTQVKAANTDAVAFVRGVSVPGGKPFATTTVTLLVQNTGQVDAPTVTIVDTVAENWSYVWGSAATTLAGAAVAVKGSNPVMLELGPLAAGASCPVTYQLQSLIPTP